MPNELSTLCKRRLPISSSPHSAFGNRHSDFGELSRVAFRIRPAPVLSQSKGFTLVELMISLAMVLILILGINFVFRSATDAVGAGQALNGINSDAQSAQPVLFNDLQNVSKNPPCFIISSQLVTQFLNSDDAKTSSDPTVIVTDNNGGAVKIANGPSPTFLSPAILGPRNHRADMLKFFAHANYHRRSGDDGTYYGPESSDDAFIEIGHAALPTNDLTAFYGPSNLPNNTSQKSIYGVPGYPRIGAYASDWALARRVTLLLDGTGAAPSLIQSKGYYPNQAKETAPPTDINGVAYPADMTPLSYGTFDTLKANHSESYTDILAGRYDLAGATPEEFDRLIDNQILTWVSANYGGTALWWNPLVYSVGLNQTGTHGEQYFPSMTTGNPPALPSPPYSVPFFIAAPEYTSNAEYLNPVDMANGGAPNIDPGQWLVRPACNPTVQTPVTAATLAQMAPYFLQHCSQFIVEYAGDYMQQDPATGKMTGMGPDGQIDFYLDAQGNKHIRWYGMPRSSTGVPHPGDSSGKQVLIRGFDPTDATVGGPDDPTAGTSPANTPLNYFTDVIPLRDYYTMYRDFYGGTPGTLPYIYIVAPPWEVDVNFAPCRDYGAYLTSTAPCTISFTNPATPGSTVTFPAFNDTTTPMPSRYVAAWHDDMPAMVRILLKVDDPNNKVKDGPWYEYVFRLK